MRSHPFLYVFFLYSVYSESQRRSSWCLCSMDKYYIYTKTGSLFLVFQVPFFRNQLIIVSQETILNRWNEPNRDVLRNYMSPHTRCPPTNNKNDGFPSDLLFSFLFTFWPKISKHWSWVFFVLRWQLFFCLRFFDILIFYSCFPSLKLKSEKKRNLRISEIDQVKT